MPSPENVDRTALQLAERLIQLLDRGGFTSTYKYAVLIALMDLCLELTSAREGLPPESITTDQLARKVIELYWPHTAPFNAEKGVLRQNSSRRRTAEGKVDTQAEIIQHIQRFRDKIPSPPAASLSLPKAIHLAGADAYEKLARAVEWTLIEWPLPRLQIIGREEDRFLYDYGFSKETSKREVDLYQQGKAAIDPVTKRGFNNVLVLRPGVGASLIALSGLLRPLVYRSWTLMVAHLNNIAESPLETFLFGAERIALDPVRPGLIDVQKGLCFYCEKALSGKVHVDHFVPWSRHADNGVDNLVVAHERCNLSKSDFLAAAEHVEHWRERSRDYAADLAQIAAQQTWESHPDRTVSVARAIYHGLPGDAHLWLSGQQFERIDVPRIVTALSA